MSETYVECLVQTKPSVLGKVLKTVLIVLTVVFGIIGMAFIPVLVLAALTGAGAYFVNLRTDVEYEYLYLDKEITVDRVMAKSKRKRVGVYTVDRMEIFAPLRSYHLDNYRNRQVKEIDYSVGEELQPDLRYAMYYEGGQRIILSPSKELVKALKNVAPRKVFSE